MDRSFIGDGLAVRTVWLGRYLFGCMILLLPSTAALATPRSEETFEVRMAAIKARFNELDQQSILGLKLLLVMPEFQRLASEDDGYVDDCLNFVSTPNRSFIERRIAEYSMSGLSSIRWVYFMDKLMDLHDGNKVSTRDVLDALMPMTPMRWHVFDVAVDVGVRSVLYRANATRDVDPAEKSAIEFFLRQSATVLRYHDGLILAP